MMVGVLSIDPLHWRHFWLIFALAWMPLATQPNPSKREPSRDGGLGALGQSR